MRLIQTVYGISAFYDDQGRILWVDPDKGSKISLDRYANFDKASEALDDGLVFYGGFRQRNLSLLFETPRYPARKNWRERENKMV
jgi:hypothetical protein